MPPAYTRIVSGYASDYHATGRQAVPGADVAGHPYILGTGDEELDRLAHQHEVWHDATVGLWDRAGFGEGQRIVDLGCGPGFTSFELAARVGPRGHVTAVDDSERFLGIVEAWCAERSVTHLTTKRADAYAPGLSPESADGMFIRWLLCFLPDTRRVIEVAAQTLAPGGRLVVLDYFHYLAIRLFPESEHFRRVFRAVHRSFADSGGNLDVGSNLLRLLHAAGLEVTHTEPLCAAARPGDPAWQWVRGFQRTYLPQLVLRDYLTQKELDDFERDWLSHENDPASLFFSPPMLGVVACKAR